MKAYAWSAVCTDFLSAYGQSIVPAQKNLRRALGQPEGAPRASVVSPPPQVAALPSNRLWPHAACQGHSRREAQATRLLLGMTPLSPFVPARRVITPGMVADGSRLPCRARATALVLQHPGPDLRPEHRRRFRTGPTQATLPHYGVSQRLAATSTWPTKPGTGLPHPEAAVVPALASVFNPEVTLLGRVTARSVWVRAVFRQAALSRHLRAGFPPTKPEDRGTVPKQRFAIWLRLLRISLASPPLPIRLGLSWLSCSPPPDLPADAEVVTPGPACHQTEAPHASRVERTRAAAQARTPRTGFHDGS